jgi:hypothetical protein
VPQIKLLLANSWRWATNRTQPRQLAIGAMVSGIVAIFAFCLIIWPATSPLWTVVSAVAAVIAAVAALATILYARLTVVEAQQSRHESQVEHEAEMVQQKQMLEEFAAARSQAQAQYEAQMAERARAFDAEVTLMRVEQFQRVIDALIDLGDTAREEVRYQPPMWDRHDVASRIPSVQVRLRAALVILNSFGAIVPAVASQAASLPPVPGATAQVANLVKRALEEIENLVHNDEKLKLRDM